MRQAPPTSSLALTRADDASWRDAPWSLARADIGWSLFLGGLAFVAIALFYVPIIGPSLTGAVAWLAALLATLAIALSLLAHRFAHLGTAWASGSQRPEILPLLMMGDPAQVWPLAPTPAREAAVALAGPFTHLALATLAYLAWDQQIHPIVNVAASFAALVNLALGLLNLAPGYPMDGGRVTRALGWALFGRPETAHRVARWLGGALIVAVTLWGIMLFLQPARFGRETGIGALLVALALAIALWSAPARVADPGARHPARWRPLRLLALAFLMTLQLAPSAGMLPILTGLYLPGFAVPVEPMVRVPDERRHDADGSFILTTVITQTPSVLGQWVYAQFDPAVRVVEPELIVPPDISPQEQVIRTYRMLDESALTAKVVAARLAGYDASLLGTAVDVVSVTAESPSRGLVLPGDRITHVNGERVRLVADLAAQLRAVWPERTARLRLERSGRVEEITTTVMPPAGPEDPPRLGITAQTAGFEAKLPFPIEITPRRIIGGPSAGLMFTLAIYNALTPEDLTSGYQIAGTGTISLDGKVGPIGGVEQKVASAERAGAAFFLVPRQNYADAQRVARTMVIVPVATVDEAIAFLKELPRQD